MENFAEAATINAVACPACGLLCDDLSIERSATGSLNVGSLSVVKKNCAKSVAFFERAYEPRQPQIAGKESDLKTAIAEAISLLRKAKHPLISGLSTDIQGMRAVM